MEGQGQRVIEQPPQLGVLMSGQSITVRCEGGSMFPVIRNGAHVRVAPLVGPPERGDVVLASMEGRWVLHRVVAVHEDTFVLRGDFRATDDAPVPRAAIAGVATHVRWRGWRCPLVWPRVARRVWMRTAPLSARLGQKIARGLRRVRR